MLTEIVSGLVGRYQATAQASHEAGNRPYLLPCEAETGMHCSTRFAQVAGSGGAASAVAELMNRCPKGPTHAVNALGWSALVALSPFGASSINDPCCPGDPTSADPCGGGDPFSQDVAKCGDC